jgi:transposase-like protein
MTFQFKTLPQLLDCFKDEETCVAYLEQQRWNGKITCPHCGHEKVYRTNRGFKCASKDCYKKFSVTVGTIFENSKITLRNWFAATFLCSAHKKGISSCQLARDLGLTQKTAWFMLHRIREAFQSEAPGLLENTVEVDETYIGGKMKNKHKSIRNKAHEDNVSHTANKTGVMGLLERENEVRVKVIDKTKTLKQMVGETVKFSSLIITDSAMAYNGLSKQYKQHETVNHINDEYVRGIYHTNTIEGFFSFLKRSIYGIYHHVSVKHLQSYCNENGYRYNTRKMKDVERFHVTLGNVEGRLTYNTLIGKTI